MEKIYIKGALKPAGHYTPAIKSHEFVYISGQLPINPFTGEKITGSVKEQATRVFENLKLILEAAECNLDDVVRVTIYVSDISYWDEINKLYSEIFKDHKPVRTIVPTNKLHYGFNLELDAIAEI